MDLGYDVIVTITGIVLVFLILVLLMAIITLEGKSEICQVYGSRLSSVV